MKYAIARIVTAVNVETSKPDVAEDDLGWVHDNTDITGMVKQRHPKAIGWRVDLYKSKPPSVLDRIVVTI